MSAFVPAPNTRWALNITAAGVGELVDAAASGRLDAVKELLAARQEMGAARDNWWNCELLALTNAGIGGHAAVVEFLLNAEPVYFTSVFSSGGDGVGGDDVLNAAAERGSVAILKLLLEAGLTKDPLAEGLQLAAANGHVAAVEFLLVSKVSHVNQINTKFRHGLVFFGPTALWTASDAGHMNVVKLLLEWGAEVNATSLRQTPLRRARAGGHDKVTELLLAAGGQEEAPKGIKTEKLDMGRFSALNLSLRKPTSVVEESRQKGTATRNKESGLI
eukprot:CAMPEP_0194345824 /NCGR_PEP_ID=MMETSP0171-20130528/105071_1 /TAXON_ID=218684 /ORGANISM="Corethron pennatum, Strain L29A3" /LENGTH=274 /DNA_ID=CAMNT_0039112851 /DNA_START=158 /DNA_END=982 /DNA_ORIENTATION=+